MTLAELAITAGLLAALGLIANRFGISAIPAYLLAGILLGPNEPTDARSPTSHARIFIFVTRRQRFL